MQKNRTKLNQRMLPFFLGGFLVLGGCSVFGAGEPIQEISDEEAETLEEGFVYIHYDEEAETKYLDQLSSAFEETNETLLQFNFFEYGEGNNNVNDFNLNNQRYAVAYYSEGEFQEEINLKDLNNEVDPDVIHRALVDFIEFNQE